MPLHRFNPAIFQLFCTEPQNKSVASIIHGKRDASNAAVFKTSQKVFGTSLVAQEKLTDRALLPWAMSIINTQSESEFVTKQELAKKLAIIDKARSPIPKEDLWVQLLNEFDLHKTLPLTYSTIKRLDASRESWNDAYRAQDWSLSKSILLDAYGDNAPPPITQIAHWLSNKPRSEEVDHIAIVLGIFGLIAIFAAFDADSIRTRNHNKGRLTSVATAKNRQGEWLDCCEESFGEPQYHWLERSISDKLGVKNFTRDDAPSAFTQADGHKRGLLMSYDKVHGVLKRLRNAKQITPKEEDRLSALYPFTVFHHNLSRTFRDRTSEDKGLMKKVFGTTKPDAYKSYETFVDNAH